MDKFTTNDAFELVFEGLNHLYEGGAPVALALTASVLVLGMIALLLFFVVRRARRRWSDAVEWRVARVDRYSLSQTALINTTDLGTRFPENTHALSIVARDEKGRAVKASAKVQKVRSPRVPPSDGGPLNVRLSDDVLEKLGILDDFETDEFKPLKVRVRSRVAPWNSPDRATYISFWTTLWVTVFTTIIAVLLELFVPSIVD